MVKKANIGSNGPQANSRSRNVNERSTSHQDGYMDSSNKSNLEYCSATKTPSINTVYKIIDLTEFSDSNEPQFIEPLSRKNSKKRKRTEEEQARRKPDVFHYDGATRRNMAPKIVYPRDRITMNRLTTRPWVREAKAAAANKPPTYLAADYLDMEDEDGFSLRPPSWPFIPRVVPVETMPLKDRKRFFIYTPTFAMMKAMRATVSEVHRFFTPIKNIGDCMLHPRPPPLRLDGGMVGKISYSYRWKDDIGIHGIHVNYGVVALLINSRLTNTQKEGWIEEAWHLSHLCGNWICCNWRHHTVEDGPTNVSRNACFASARECRHEPPCMKEKKRKLVLPAYRGRQGQVVVVPGMTDEDVNGVEEEESEGSGCATDCECRDGVEGEEVRRDEEGDKKDEDDDEDDEDDENGSDDDHIIS
ncbi:MAG: hypothetical protein HETSPECPRED_007718 [Heterodermia speciosa]|uniref:Zinc-binding loop region of homing endonuclease domain-containing protein n=1 Tax=Heterodermia speciosa TaxID=116794 RepID=A0A8H3IXB6_9LECA|nr:MAG: hypothetical protein HETSPECPRED_007718 [Heterodermia speciosa]